MSRRYQSKGKSSKRLFSENNESLPSVASPRMQNSMDKTNKEIIHSPFKNYRKRNQTIIECREDREPIKLPKLD